jgi:hypothetical protein
MLKAVCHLPFTMAAHIQSHASLCEICGGPSGMGTGFSLNIQFFPVY